MAAHSITKLTGLMALAGAGAIVATPAIAHAIDGAGAGLGGGFAHAFTGLDHLLLLIGLGLWSGHAGRPYAWRLPVAFFVAVTAGFGLGWAGVAVPYLELGIAGSVLLLGLLVLFAVSCRPGIAVAVAAIFGVLHGCTHGMEMPASAMPVLYVAGMLAAVAALYCFGLASCVTIRSLFTRRVGIWSVRAIGLVVTGSGMMMVAV